MRSFSRFFIADRLGGVVAEEDNEDAILKVAADPGSTIFRLADRKPLYRRELVSLDGGPTPYWVVVSA